MTHYRGCENADLNILSYIRTVALNISNHLPFRTRCENKHGLRTTSRGIREGEAIYTISFHK